MGCLCVGFADAISVIQNKCGLCTHLRVGLAATELLSFLWHIPEVLCGSVYLPVSHFQSLLSQ